MVHFLRLELRGLFFSGQSIAKGSRIRLVRIISSRAIYFSSFIHVLLCLCYLNRVEGKVEKSDFQ